MKRRSEGFLTGENVADWRHHRMGSRRSKSEISNSIERARRTSTKRAVTMASATIAVVRGKRQKSHSIIPADTVSIAINATVLARVDEFMPIPPCPRRSHYTDAVLDRLYRRTLNFLIKHSYSFFSRAWFRAASVARSTRTARVRVEAKRRPTRRGRASRSARPSKHWSSIDVGSRRE
jgi:hypothetical protein